MLISHMLGEMLQTSDRVVVMRDGRVVVDGPTRPFDRAALVVAMGGAEARAPGGSRRRREAAAAGADAGAHPSRADSATGANSSPGGRDRGLRGPGRPRPDRLAAAVFDAAGRRSPAAEVNARVALVAGDRQSDGVFPLWSIAENIGVRSFRQLRRGPLLSPEPRTRSPRAGRSGSRSARPTCAIILSLSGGNQQKALFARALGSDAEIVLMDDPMRGVDSAPSSKSTISCARRPSAAAPSSGTRPRWRS